MTAPQLPSIPDRAIVITSFGAVGDGQTVNTAAIARAIETCAKAGGGKVVVPAGVWLTGPIQLAGNIELHLDSGALLLFTRRYQDYAAPDSAAADPRARVLSPISATNVDNIAITGQGTIDGSGDAWRPVKKGKMTAAQWKGLVDSGGVLNQAADTWYPTAAALKPGSLEAMRPVMIAITNCRRVLLDGPTFQNSPSWNIHPLLSEDIVVRNVIVRNDWFAQNGDGIDIDACRRVVVYNSHFDTGDDAICIKSGAGEAARRRGRAAEEIVISNCTVHHGHGGVTIGSEMSGGVRNVFVDNCVFLGTDEGLRFKSTRGRGGVVENLYFRNIYMRGIATDAIGFTMSYGGSSPTDESPAASSAAVPKADETTPLFRQIHFDNIVCVGAKRAVHLEGLPELPIESVDFANLTISAQTGFETLFAKGIHVTATRILPERGPVFRITETAGVSLDKSDGLVILSGARTTGIHVTTPAANVKFENGAGPAALIH